MLSNTALKRYESAPKNDIRSKHAELVDAHAKLVRTVAHRIFRRLPHHIRGFEEEDLVSVGIMGLLDAHERYNPDSGVSFDSFAEFRIKGAILDEIRRHDFFPRRLRAKANQLHKVVAKLEVDTKRSPTNQEIADAMEISVDDVVKLKSEVAQYSMVSDEECVSLKSPHPRADVILMDKELKQQLVVALKALPEKEQLVLDLYFNRELKLKEIGEVLDISEGRVSQLKTEALKRLKDLMKS